MIIIQDIKDNLCRNKKATRYEKIVKTHFKNIYEKLEVGGKVEAIKIAQSRGYIASV